MNTHIFAQHAQTFIDLELSIIPVKPREKRPAINGWQQYCTRRATDAEIFTWSRDFPAASIGLCLGPASGLVAFDFDYDYGEKSSISKAKFETDLRKIEANLIDKYLPETTLAKKGAKGWTRFYKYNGQTSLTCDRNGVRCFDFLSTGRQTVIPPSIHPNSDVGHYIWTLDDIHEVDLASIPILNMESVNELYSILNNTTAKLGGRHGNLFKYILSVARVDDRPDFITARVIEHDKKINGANAYFEDEKHFGYRSGTVHDRALGWVQRVLSWKTDNELINGKSSVHIDYESYEAFFDIMYPNAIKDRLSGDFLSKDNDGIWQPQTEPNDIKALKSYAKERGLKRTEVEDHLCRYIKEKPSKLIFEPPEWDGIDRIAGLKDYISIRNCDFSVFEDLFKQWGANCWGRIFNHDIQNTCIVLLGEQGIGKDHLIKSITSHFDHYYTKFMAQTQQKDMWSTYSSKVVVHIEEFEQTDKISLGVLKALITQEMAEFRKAYGKGDIRRHMRCSFISSVNFEEFLRDPTGNRRFQVFDIESINWDHPSDWSPQFVAQFKYLYETGYKAKKENINLMKELVKTYEYVRIDDLIIQEWDKKLYDIYKVTQREELNYSDVHQAVIALRSEFGKPMNFILGVIKKAGRSKHTKKGTTYCVTRKMSVVRSSLDNSGHQFS